MPPTPQRRRIGALLLVLPLIAALAACGTDATGDGARSPAGPHASPTRASDSFEEYQLAFAQCMRGEGIDMEDPGSGGQSITRADDALLEAAETCRTQLGEPPAGEGAPGGGRPSSEDLRREHLEIAACLREQGVDVPDPGPGEDLEIPSDVPAEAFATCAPRGVMGSTGGGR